MQVAGSKMQKARYKAEGAMPASHRPFVPNPHPVSHIPNPVSPNPK